MTADAPTAILVVGLCALGGLLLTACLTMTRRTRRRMKCAARKGCAARPPFGNSDWVASPDFLLHVAGHIRRHEPKRIVVCGGGQSIIVMARLLKSLGREGHIYAIADHVPTIERVRAQLRQHHLERFVTLVAAPLAKKHCDGVEALLHWHDLAPDAIPANLDLLVVDGPASMVDPCARYPVGPELLPRLSRDAHIFVDDTVRPEERVMLHRWRRFYPDLGIRKLNAEKSCCELFFLDRKIEAYLPSEWTAAGKAVSLSAPSSPRH